MAYITESVFDQSFYWSNLIKNIILWKLQTSVSISSLSVLPIYNPKHLKSCAIETG